MDPDPLVRTSFWTMSIGLSILWSAGSGVGQTTVQRFLSVPSLKAGRRYQSINMKIIFHSTSQSDILR